MAAALDLFFEKINQEESFADKLFKAESPEDVQEIAKEYGVTLSLEEVAEARNILEQAIDQNQMGELSDDDLDNVAGGAVITATAVTAAAIFVGKAVAGGALGAVGAAAANKIIKKGW